MHVDTQPEAGRFFNVVERHSLDLDLILQVLRGEVAGAMFRSYCPEAECDSLLQRFVSNPKTRVRSGDATGYYLGSFHWGKEMDQYLRDTISVRDAVSEAVGTGSTDVWPKFIRSLQAELLLSEHTVRHARFMGESVSSPIVRSWMGAGEFSLIPHEDLAQCTHPAQRDFEIQCAVNYSVCSVNMCVGNEGGGDLIVWNYSPTQSDRRAYDTEYTGGPYGADVVSEIDRIDVTVRKGDLYIFNGGLVHAVKSTVGQRATVSTLIGYISNQEVVMWT